MKKLILGLSLALMSATAMADGGHGATVNTKNDSKDAVAIGGDVLVGIGGLSATPTSVDVDLAVLSVTGGTALAGSVLVDSCKCYKKINVMNKSNGALAVGTAAAGSTIITGKHSYGGS